MGGWGVDGPRGWWCMWCGVWRGRGWAWEKAGVRGGNAMVWEMATRREADRRGSSGAGGETCAGVRGWRR